jgi:hypothetical protein
MAPIILMRMEKGYRLIAGERRLHACPETVYLIPGIKYTVSEIPEDYPSSLG